MSRARLVLDLETCSVLDLPGVGAHVYAEHPSTQITVLCYQIGTGPVRSWTDGPPPDDFVAHVRAGGWVVAHNYLFECWLYEAKLVPQGWPRISLDQWSCTMARGLVAGYPARLELLARAACLPVHKDSSARDLMLRCARPRRYDEAGVPVWWHQTDPDKFAALCAYCAKDVATEAAADRVLPDLSPDERLVFEADHDLNERGFRVDARLVSRLQTLTSLEKTRLNAVLDRVTAGAVTTGSQVARIQAWLGAQGIVLPTLRRDTVQHALDSMGHNALPDGPRTVLQARLDVSRSSTAKLGSIQRSVSRDGRLRGTVQYYGANRTGRWAGRRVQPQNFFKSLIKDVPAAIDLIEQGASPEDLDLLFEVSPMGVLASCLRSTIEAAPGHVLAAADLSQIEARVVCWLAGQHDLLAVFAKGEDVYRYTANHLGSSSRQLGKVLVLACGFGMGPERFQQTAMGYGLDLSAEDAERAVMGWRKMNHKIVTYWWQGYETALQVTRARPGSAERHGHVTYVRDPDALRVILPSGRALVYREAEVRPNPDHGHEELTYMGSLAGGWTRLRSWKGKLTENLVQAVARDVIALAMVRMRAKGVPLIATIHDELVAEVPEADGPKCLAWMLWALRCQTPWMRGLPLAAEGFVGRRYRKG